MDMLVFQMWQKISRVLHIRGWVRAWLRWVVGSSYPSDVVCKGAVNILQTKLQGKALSDNIHG